MGDLAETRDMTDKILSSSWPPVPPLPSTKQPAVQKKSPDKTPVRFNPKAAEYYPVSPAFNNAANPKKENISFKAKAERQVTPAKSHISPEKYVCDQETSSTKAISKTPPIDIDHTKRNLLSNSTHSCQGPESKASVPSTINFNFSLDTIESLKSKCQFLQTELKNEKEAHEVTQQVLSTSRDEVLSLKSEVAELKADIE